MTSCGICGGTLRSDETTYAVRKTMTSSKTSDVCASCVNKYRLSNEIS